MDENNVVLCTKSHGMYKEGRVYQCIYSTYSCSSEKFYKVYADKEFQYAQSGASNCNLDYFVRITKLINLGWHSKRKIISFINKIFHTKFEEDQFCIRTYDFTKINNDFYGKIYTKICIPLMKVRDSNFYRYHQEKVDYILKNILVVYKNRDYIDFDSQTDEYIRMINIIVESIKRFDEKEENAESEAIKSNMNAYIERQKELFSNWEHTINEVWKV